MGSNFLANNDVIKEGDTAIVYVNPNNQYAIAVKRGVTLHMKYGALRHEFIIGKRYGIPISATAGYIYVLRANPNLWTKTLTKKTQILYTPDIGIILLLLEVRSGSIICETGTGSGSLTHAIATAIAPIGHVYSYDIEEKRIKHVQDDLKAHGLLTNATVIRRDVCQEGFSTLNCDGIFLDLPSPWLAIKFAKSALNPSYGGRLVSFSPCIEQVQQVCKELDLNGFVEIETIEVVPNKLKVIEVSSETLLQSAIQGSNPPIQFKCNYISNDKVIEENPSFVEKSVDILDTISFPPSQPTHTGYLTSATLLPRIQLRSSN